MAPAADDDSPPSPQRTTWRWIVVLGALLALASLTHRRPSADPYLPLPASTLGFAPCADGHLATSEQLLAYYRQLDAASPRLQLVDIGTTTEGRPHVMAIVSAERTMADLARFKATARRLARAEGLDEATAHALAREGKAVVWIDFGLHSNEVAGPLAAASLLHHVVSDDSPEMRTIRDNVILLLVPDMNPDGTTRWATWFDAQRGGPFARAPLPELFHRYAGHDINRDWFMFTQRETRNVARQLYAEWFPQIVLDQHQAPPFPARIFIPPYADPVNPLVPEGVRRGIATLGEAMGRRLAAEGKAGALSRLQYDAWWNGGMRTAPMFHNMIGLLAETAHPWPWPVTHDPARFPRAFANGVSTSAASPVYPSPFTGGTGGLQQACDYMQAASLAVLHDAATRRVDWQYGMYEMGRDAIRAGAHETYVVSADQWDAGAAAAMIDALRLGGIDVARATAPFTFRATDGAAVRAAYPAGSYVIRGGQPFRPYLADLMGSQRAPEQAEDGADLSRSYDLTGWTLPLQMGVAVDRIDGEVTVPAEPVSERPRPIGGVSGIGRATYLLDTRADASFAATNRLLAGGEHIARAARPFTADGRDWPAGTFIVATSGERTHRRVVEAAEALGVSAVALDTAPSVQQAPLRVLRTALYQPWGDNPDAGWTRWVLEQHAFPFDVVHDDDIRRGGLPARFDVIVLPDATLREMRDGLAPERTPPRYTGGLGDAGIAALAAFVHGGGTLVTLGRAGALPIEALHVPVRDLTAGMSRQLLQTSGVLLRIVPEATHPLSWGLPPAATAMVVDGHAYETLAAPPGGTPSRRAIAVRYASSDLLASGWMRGAPLLAGQAAVVDLEVGAGRVILIGVRAQHRGQTVGTFKLLFNALLRPTVAD